MQIGSGACHRRSGPAMYPAEPPLIMRNTVFCLTGESGTEEIAQSVERMVSNVREYVPGYRLKQPVQFDAIGTARPVSIPGMGEFRGVKTSIYLEIEGAGHYLPKYAGNLDIMTSAALRTGEQLAHANELDNRGEASFETSGRRCCCLTGSGAAARQVSPRPTAAAQSPITQRSRPALGLPGRPHSPDKRLASGRKERTKLFRHRRIALDSTCRPSNSNSRRSCRSGRNSPSPSRACLP